MSDRRRSDDIPAAATIFAGIAGAALLTHVVTRRSRRFDLHGKVVLITGGSRGLGLIMARQLARQGARLAICARDAAELQRTQAELARAGTSVFAVPCDLTKPHDVEVLVRSVREALGPIDVLINNAGIIQVAPMQNLGESDYREAMDTHFWAPYRLTELVLPDMRASGGGRIVNISSIGGRVPAPHLAPYVASKHALIGYSRTMRNELARENILVTTVAPGLMRTGSPRNISVSGNVAAEYAWFKLFDSIPLTSMNADRAAAKIINAMVYGDADLTLTLSAKFGAAVQSLFPNASATLGGLINSLLPKPSAGRATKVSGAEAESGFTRSPIMSLTDRAAQRNNELGERS